MDALITYDIISTSDSSVINWNKFKEEMINKGWKMASTNTTLFCTFNHSNERAAIDMIESDVLVAGHAAGLRKCKVIVVFLFAKNNLKVRYFEGIKFD